MLLVVVVLLHGAVAPHCPVASAAVSSRRRFTAGHLSAVHDDGFSRRTCQLQMSCIFNLRPETLLAVVERQGKEGEGNPPKVKLSRIDTVFMPSGFSAVPSVL